MRGWMAGVLLSAAVQAAWGHDMSQMGGGSTDGEPAKSGSFSKKAAPLLESLEWDRKNLQALFPVRGWFEEKKLSLTDKQWSEMKDALGVESTPGDREVKYCEVLDEEDGKLLGWVFTFKVGPPAAKLPAGVAIRPGGLVRSVGVLTLEPGFPLAKPSFLDQFEGMGLDSDWSYGTGVQPAERVEKEGEELAVDVHKALFWTKALRPPEGGDESKGR